MGAPIHACSGPADVVRVRPCGGSSPCLSYSGGMRFSELSTRTTKDHGTEDISRNAQLLVRAGFVSRLMAGVYSFLPLGLRTLTKIEDVVRAEMNRIGGQARHGFAKTRSLRFDELQMEMSAEFGAALVH